MPAQPSLASRLPALSYLLLAIYLVILAFRTHNDTTMALVVASVVMFACCWASATHLLGAGGDLRTIQGLGSVTSTASSGQPLRSATIRSNVAWSSALQPLDPRISISNDHT